MTDYEDISNKNIELIFNALLNNNKIDELQGALEIIRIQKSPDYFAFQLGIYYSLNPNKCYRK